MNRTQEMVLAHAAMVRAENLARDAERVAHGSDHWKAESLAAAGTLWSHIARSHILIAAALEEEASDV
ncbi:hypothetical protein [Streptomyces sp. VNUA74]|uniref:hypothetical protein n=1 Tax=Streptomyces sp. VNUA74 TaxID=3062685 RepID=UPI00280C1FF7|nr:hypothetical protein [Streptomyces sp. VNUA74]WML79199.1 hypothetical protein Q3101_04800 [Streptomyces sp. VNUA74]